MKIFAALKNWLDKKAEERRGRDRYKPWRSLDAGLIMMEDDIAEKYHGKPATAPTKIETVDF